MKNKIKQKIILVIALLTVTCLSIPYLGLNFINQADAKIKWRSDESGGEEPCVFYIRIETGGEFTINRQGVSVKEGRETVPYRGNQGTCSDASIWYVCSVRCEIDESYTRID
ncbi:hypothetical protein [Roseivirga sp.]|uniref:hypothetical protein n=1 Tax=Roseivirga sp. TaxID=1964215 RepID=UPI002B279846|nr:hypothetical protein [Roseivirga sp.]